MPQGTAFFWGKGWSATEALKGQIGKERCELASVRQRDSLSPADCTSSGIPPSRAGLGCLGWLLCHSSARCEPLQFLITG